MMLASPNAGMSLDYGPVNEFPERFSRFVPQIKKEVRFREDLGEMQKVSYTLNLITKDLE